MLKLKEGYIIREVAGQIVALPTGDDLDLNVMITLNGTGKFLWELIEKGSDVDSLVAALLAEYDVDEATARTGVERFVAKLNEPIALGGLKEWTQKNTSTDSIPYLRNVPVLKWLIAKDSNTFTEEEILTIVCVRKMAKAGEVDPVAVELNKMKQAEDKVIKDRETDKHKNDGKWYEFWRW